MAELQRQIGDHARATAEASPRSTVGDVIQPGQAIPDDVTWVTDTAGDQQQRGDDGLWHQGGVGNDPVPWPGEKLMGWAPFTVTAVREQPGKPCWKCGLTVGEIVDRGAGAFADGRLRFMHAYGECPTADQLAQHTAEGIAEPLDVTGLIRDAREIMLLLGVTEAADVLPELTRRLAEPEPQQADEPALLDLVRQYGDECDARAACRVHGLGERMIEHGENARALLARIAALVPQPAPPPRTWPKLDPVPDNLRHVRGASGTVYVRSSGTFAFNGYRNGQSVTRSLHALQEEDGPLTEVLDNEPGGER